MTEQLTLPMQPIVVPDHAPEATIEDRFRAFHDANPWVLSALESMTGDLLGRGRRRVGIGMLFEVLRWEYGRRTVGDDFRLNNNMRSRYARLIMERHPEWIGVFETRQLRAA